MSALSQPAPRRPSDRRARSTFRPCSWSCWPSWSSGTSWSADGAPSGPAPRR